MKVRAKLIPCKCQFCGPRSNARAGDAIACFLLHILQTIFWTVLATSTTTPYFPAEVLRSSSYLLTVWGHWYGCFCVWLHCNTCSSVKAILGWGMLCVTSYHTYGNAGYIFIHMHSGAEECLIHMVHLKKLHSHHSGIFYGDELWNSRSYPTTTSKMYIVTAQKLHTCMQVCRNGYIYIFFSSMLPLAEFPFTLSAL